MHLRHLVACSPHKMDTLATQINNKAPSLFVWVYSIQKYSILTHSYTPCMFECANLSPLLPQVLPVHDRGHPPLLSRRKHLLFQVAQGQSPPALVSPSPGPGGSHDGRGLHDRQQERLRAPPSGHLAQPSGGGDTGGHLAPSRLWPLPSLTSTQGSVSTQAEALPCHLWVGGVSPGDGYCGRSSVHWLVPGHSERVGVVCLCAAPAISRTGGDESDYECLSASQEDHYIGGHLGKGSSVTIFWSGWWYRQLLPLKRMNDDLVAEVCWKNHTCNSDTPCVHTFKAALTFTKKLTYSLLHTHLHTVHSVLNKKL